MTQLYVEKVGAAYRLAGSRVALDSIVHAYWNGQTAESIAQSFPTLSLEQVYGALAFYLSRQAEIDAYLADGDANFQVRQEASRGQDAAFYQRLSDARRADRSAR